MSLENLETVRAGFAAWLRGDVAGMLEHAASDLVTVRHPPLPDAGTYRGGDGLLRSIADWVEGFDDFTATAHEYVDPNDRQGHVPGSPAEALAAGMPA